MYKIFPHRRKPERSCFSKWIHVGTVNNFFINLLLANLLSIVKTTHTNCNGNPLYPCLLFFHQGSPRLSTFTTSDILPGFSTIKIICAQFSFSDFQSNCVTKSRIDKAALSIFFRYSTNSLSLIFTFAGWLFGQAAFSYFSKLLLTRVERDSPMLYLLVKRSIYTTFSIVFVSIAVAYLGRAPAPFFTEKYVNQFYAKDLHFWKLTGYKSLFWWAFQPWPFSFFDPTRHNRGHRFVRNSRLYRGKSFVKRRVSTYFFQKCLTDGKERLSFASLPSLAIFEKQICGSLPTRAHSRLGTRLHLLSQTWVLEKLVRTKRVEKELTDRVVLLDNDYSFSKAMEKRTRLKSRKRSRIPQVYDPFVNNFRMRIPIPHTYLTLAELNMKRHGPIKERKLIRKD
ncbi:hypothetical protein KP509_05G047400 [Ceratopteris richardii]|uniref:Translocon at the inner envelope membrane of chloroplasts 214 n=1 Tax=Ceratopteris richardii TaxID=49495 RepID=A0A8T2ULD8_CERRI|nr:hypothetical protein KP509_05G047400 [Ceratopteris richardii]